MTLGRRDDKGQKMKMMRTLQGVLVLLFLLMPGSLALAQNSKIANSFGPLIEQAKKDGMTVVIMAPEPAETATAQTDAQKSMTDQGLHVRREVKRLLTHSGNIPERVSSALEIASPDGTWWWLAKAIAVAVAGILIGLLPARLMQRWGREYFRYMYNPEPADRAEKVGYLLFRSAIFAIYLALLFAVAATVAIIADDGHLPTRQTTMVLILAFVAWRFIRYVVLFNLLAPDSLNHRMLNLDTPTATMVYRDLYWGFGVAVVLIAISEWMSRLDLDGDAHKLLLIVSTILGALLIGAMLIRHRTPLAQVIMGAGDPASKPLWRRVLSRGWLALGMVYLVVAVMVTVVRVLLGLPSATILIAAPLIAFIVGLAAYGIFLVLIDTFYRNRRNSFERRVAMEKEKHAHRLAMEEAARAEADTDATDEVTMLENQMHPPLAMHQPDMIYRPIFQSLFEQAAAVLVSIVAFGFVLGVWDVRVGERGNPLTAFMGTLVVTFAAWFLYRAVNDYINRKLADEGISEVNGAAIDMDDEPSAHNSSRLGTLLPLLRIVLSSTIIAIAGMIVLSGVGVDVAPLFAGAGVVGLAVGFGAQTLIRDIFSGAFFLFDDAFRKGEYVELGAIRGTVEKISLRSFQLRHHNGPLHTIPFGEITQLTNYSRDWVIMKLPLRLTYDTDIDRVRRLIKKLGVELLANPEVGKYFLQPLKSQGVVGMEDSAMIVRVKFMTRPNDQWQTRKVVYSSIQELFKREGIRFANREVTVRISNEDAQLSPETTRKAASAAARRILDDEVETGGVGEVFDD